MTPGHTAQIIGRNGSKWPSGDVFVPPVHHPTLHTKTRTPIPWETHSSGQAGGDTHRVHVRMRVRVRMCVPVSVRVCVRVHEMSAGAAGGGAAAAGAGAGAGACACLGAGAAIAAAPAALAAPAPAPAATTLLFGQRGPVQCQGGNKLPVRTPFPLLKL